MAGDVVGGVFGLELSDHPTPPPFGHDALGFVNARSALRWLLQRLQPDTLWVPSYLCEAVLIGAAGVCKTSFYEVDDRLQISSASWTPQVTPGDAVLFIDYFGFRDWVPIAEQVRRRGAAIIEDAAQALYLPRAAVADSIIYSPRKFIGVADGGLLSGVPQATVTLAEPPLEWWRDAFLAVFLRHAFDHGADTREWFRLFQESERNAPAGDYRLSDVSKAQLLHTIDYEAARRLRIENYETLAQSLGDVALLPALGDAVVPLGFPVRLQRRDAVRDALFDAGIYPATHWPLRGVVPERFAASHSLADSILTLPCDQRYDRDTMDRIVAVVREAMQ